jgi:WD40 repeat protein
LAGAERQAAPAPQAASQPLGGRGALAAGATPRPGRSGVAAGFGGAGASPAPRLAVAATATVLVSTGGREPLKLGAQVASLDAAGVLHVWDWSAGDVSRPLDVTCRGAFAVTPDGAAIVTADGRRIDVATGAAEPLDNFAGNVRRVQFSPDGQTLVLQVEQPDDTAIIRLLDAKTAEPRVEIPRQFIHMFAAAFTADGAELFLMDKDMFIGRWDAWSGESRARYEPAHTNSIRALAVSADRTRMVSAGPEGEIFLWDVATGKLLHRLVAKQQYGLPSMAYALQFSPDGKRLAGGGPQNLVLWNTESGEVERMFPSSSGGAVHIRFTEDGRFLTTVREAHGHVTEAGQSLLVYPGVHYWDAESGKAVDPLRRSG